MYYRLKEPWSFRGWKYTPYAIRAEYGEKQSERPFFYEKEPFLDLLYCGGDEDVDIDTLPETSQVAIRELLAQEMMEESCQPLPPLKQWQRYHVFPSRYVKAVHWSITGKCNLCCRHCLVSAPDAHLPQLPLEDILHIVDEMARCGIKRVDITGGEPLLRKDFEQIVEALSTRGIAIAVIFTNATLLDAELLDMLKRYGQQPFFQLSFDGLGHHDWLRGVPGSEMQADAAFRLLQDREFPVNVAMCIHRENRDSLRDTVNYLAGYGVNSLRLNAPQEFGEWKQYGKDYALSEGEVWDVYRAYIEDYFADGMPIGIELDGYFQCLKGETDYSVTYVHHVGPDANWGKVPYCESARYNMHIGPDGRVYPCMAFSNSGINDAFPSVLEQSLSDITLSGFYRDVVETTVADLMAKNPECASCEHLPRCCGGCMVQGMTETGDYLVPDPRICYFFKHVGEAAVRSVADAAIAKMQTA